MLHTSMPNINVKGHGSCLGFVLGGLDLFFNYLCVLCVVYCLAFFGCGLVWFFVVGFPLFVCFCGSFLFFGFFWGGCLFVCWGFFKKGRGESVLLNGTS